MTAGEGSGERHPLTRFPKGPEALGPRPARAGLVHGSVQMGEARLPALVDGVHGERESSPGPVQRDTLPVPAHALDGLGRAPLRGCNGGGYGGPLPRWRGESAHILNTTLR